jgi:hypothetical protein
VSTREYSLTRYGWSCPDCGALVINTPVHDAWHSVIEKPSRSQPVRPTAADRERWRQEIAEAKRTMSPKGFTDWLQRKINSIGEATLS